MFVRIHASRPLALTVPNLFATVRLAVAGFAAHAKMPSAPTEGWEIGASEPPVMLDTLNAGLLSRYISNLTPLSGRTLRASGETGTYRVVETISVTLYLQYWDSSAQQWEDSKTIGTWIGSNSSLAASGPADLSVPGGYYYRVRGFHSAKNGSLYESTETYTGYVYVE